MAFPDLLGLSASGIRGSVVQVCGGVTSTGSSSAPVCDGFTLFQTPSSRNGHHECSSVSGKDSSREAV